jgi:O-antigen/teichoic acid export membrane protein
MSHSPIAGKANRFQLLLRGIGLGYVSMAVNMAYSLISIPLALRYLEKSEYGLWALVLSITSYLGISEMGMSSSMERHLMELKEKRPDPRYGETFCAGALVLGILAILCLSLGSVVIYFVSKGFHLPSESLITFRRLLFGAVALYSFTLATRVLATPLHIYQRHDLFELSNIGLFLIWILSLWLGFRAGFGVYALLLSQGVGLVWSCAFNIVACNRLTLYPLRQEWRFPSREVIGAMTRYAGSSFILQFSNQVTGSLPIMIISRWIGLDGGATWAVATRPYAILQQTLSRPFQYGFSILTDLFANVGRASAMDRWRKLAVFMSLAAVGVLPVAWSHNGDFLALWTSGKLAWSHLDNNLFALYSLVVVILFPWGGVIGIDKTFGFTKWGAVLEPVIVLGLGLFTIPYMGLAGVAFGMLAGRFLIWFAPTWWYLRKLFGTDAIWVSSRDLLIRPLMILPFCALLSWTCREVLLGSSSNWGRFVLSVLLSLGMNAVLVIVLGMKKELKDEVKERLSRFSLMHPTSASSP